MTFKLFNIVLIHGKDNTTKRDIASVVLIIRASTSYIVTVFDLKLCLRIVNLV